MAMQSKNINLNAADSAPAKDYAAVTPADNTLLPDGPARALYIGVSGDVTVRSSIGGTAVLFKSHPVGYLLGGAASVDATGTTATNIVALM